MAKKYDIFISYRRLDNSGNTSGRDIARTLKLELEKRGYKVFFDYSEIKDNAFISTILPAIKESKYFLLVLSTDALSRCINDGDWVRREIYEAINSDCKIIPVSPDGQFHSWPTNMPMEIRKITGIQVSDIAMGSLFEKSVDKLVEERFSKSRIKYVIPLIIILIVFFAAVIWNSYSKTSQLVSKKNPQNHQISQSIEDDRDIKYIIRTFLDSFDGSWCYWGVFNGNNALIPKSSIPVETTEQSIWHDFPMHLDYSIKLYYNNSPYSIDALNHACVCYVSLFGSNSGPDLLYIANLTAMNEPEASFPQKIMEDLDFTKTDECGFPSFSCELYMSKDKQFLALLETGGGSAGLFYKLSIALHSDYVSHIVGRYVGQTYMILE